MGSVKSSQLCTIRNGNSVVKILFLDLDGTVRETKSGNTFINNPCDQKLISGVEEAIAHHTWARHFN